MATITHALSQQTGWLRSRRFDFTFVQVIAIVALMSGVVVLAQPELMWAVITADLWLLGYHHVVSTFTRLAFDARDLRTYWFFVFVLPLIVFAATFGLAWSVGVWTIATIYLYWQWFHYTRQSWGISQVYRAKSGGLATDGAVFSKICFYLVPAWGILHRSAQAPDQFLFSPIRVLPVPTWLAGAVGVAAIAATAIWVHRRIRDWQRGELAVPHTLYMLSHFTIFLFGYILIDDITAGWLVINIWHNAQYVLFVWMFNTNRFRDTSSPGGVFLKTISQRKNVALYLLTCFTISTAVYLLASRVGSGRELLGVPLLIIIFQGINFHHYVVDSFIWKVRKKPLQQTLQLSPALYSTAERLSETPR